MSPQHSYLEAVNNIFDVLRVAETREDANFVLIADLLYFLNEQQASSEERSESRELP
jgi:hypothetical protein